MITFGLFVIFAFNICGVPAPHGHVSKFCYSCHDQVDLAACTAVEKCHAEGRCGAEVHNHDGINLYRLGCYEQHECDHMNPLLGKRARHDPITCQQCCVGELCNKNLCGMGSSATTIAPVDTGSTSGPVVTGGCVDHEEDGFTCSVLDKAHFCTDPSTLSYFIAHQKCPKYCGFCDSNGNNIAPAPQVSTLLPTQLPTQLPTDGTASPDMGIGGITISIGGNTAAPDNTDSQCVDIESNGFQCANFDMFNFCTDPSSFAYPLAVEKCKAHCGFCTKTGD